jgi:hypothetical protein
MWNEIWETYTFQPIFLLILTYLQPTSVVPPILLIKSTHMNHILHSSVQTTPSLDYS